MRLYLARHGETEWNIEKRTQGKTDTVLTEKGRIQAEKLGHRLSDCKIIKIYTSTLKRAQETAKIIGKKVPVSIEQVECLQEVGFGDWEGLKSDDIERNFPKELYQWRQYPEKCRFPQGDSFEDVCKFIDLFMERIKKLHPSEEVLLVSHSLISKIIIMDSLKMPACFIHQIRQSNGALSIIDFYGDKAVLTLLNDTCHLKGV